METPPVQCQGSADASRPETEGPCSANGEEQGVTIRVTNSIQAPHFDFQTTLPYVLGSSLHSYLERAAEKDSRFRITVSYYGKTLGYTVNVVDLDTSASGAWWELVNAEGPLQLGPSNYKPRVGETIQFVLVKNEGCPSTETSRRRYGVTLHVINSIQDPNFDFKITVPYVRESSLLSCLERAADVDERFRFNVTDCGKSLGYYLDGLNGLKADYEADETWWKLVYSSTPGPTVGISNYVPEDGEIIQFILTKGARSADNFRPRPGVKLHVTNSVKDPNFDFYTVQPYVAGSSLRLYLERAAEENTKFRFTAKYDGQTEEYSLIGINNLVADDESGMTWKLADSEGRQLDEGISKYVPKDGETVQLIFSKSEAD